MDVSCARCGERWDYYGLCHGEDMAADDADRFLKGEGCPSCNFGTTCVQCNGGGHYQDPVTCMLCHGRGLMLARSISNAFGFQNVPRKWYVGYLPNVCDVTGAVFVREERGFESCDGWVLQAWMRCPNASKHPICPLCRGDGKFRPPDGAEDLELEAARSETEASDEDPAEILERRGLLK